MNGKSDRTFNAAEIHGMEYIAALDCKLKYFEEKMERILRDAGAWRDYRIAASAAERTIDKLYAIADTKTLLHMQRLCAHGEIIIRPKPAAKPPECLIVDKKDLAILINGIMGEKCAICVCDRAAQKACKIRKTLAVIAPTNKVPKDGACPYMDVVATNDLGEYIDE